MPIVATDRANDTQARGPDRKNRDHIGHARLPYLPGGRPPYPPMSAQARTKTVSPHVVRSPVALILSTILVILRVSSHNLT